MIHPGPRSAMIADAIAHYTGPIKPEDVRTAALIRLRLQTERELAIRRRAAAAAIERQNEEERRRKEEEARHALREAIIKIAPPALPPAPPIHRRRHIVTFIQQTVCKYYDGMTVDTLIGYDSRRALLEPRCAAAYLVRTLTKFPINSAKRLFHKDHSTLLFYIGRAKEKLATDMVFKQKIGKMADEIRAEMSAREATAAAVRQAMKENLQHEKSIPDCEHQPIADGGGVSGGQAIPDRDPVPLQPEPARRPDNDPVGRAGEHERQPHGGERQD